MIEIKNKQIIIDGKAVLIMAGELHYFRLKVCEWQDRIDKLKAAGCNTVASYVPWICHEPIEGEVDLVGKTHPELDLAKFIDLCHENDLYFFIRPGPFIMAEMKNEGIPHWVYDKYPEILPVGWDGKPGTTKTIDYLAPNFLKASRAWYREVMAVAAPRLQTNGGNIIGVQLDNEVGMLSWVSNTPDLTEIVVADFIRWLKSKYDAPTLTVRYPFDLDDEETRINDIRSPKEAYVSELHFDLGYYMRYRFAKYIHELRTFTEESGVKDIPFIVNIHGTGGGRGFTFPIGISQLYESYTQAPGYLSGSDIYFGDLDMLTFQDLYLINGFMDAVHHEDQPLTSVEFNCGDGNFGETYGGRLDVSAADHKARMCLAQGNRLINYYLMAGGRNYRIDQDLQDGNNRIAFTGERHGFAAPINPEGELNYTYPRMARSIKTMMAVADHAATMNEERDQVSFAFIPDYFMTEYRYPESEKMKEIYANLEANRAYGAWEIMGRSMLLAGYRFGAVDIQNRSIDVEDHPVVALPCAKYLHRYVQEKLVNYLGEGGALLVYGELPLYDMEGNSCTILIDHLGLNYVTNEKDGFEQYLSLTAKSWVAPRPEMRVHHAQIFEMSKGCPLFEVYGTGALCGFDIPLEKGHVIALTMSYRCDIDLFRTALERLGAPAGLIHDEKEHGIFMTSTINATKERFIHILNLDGFDKQFHIYDEGKKMLDGRLFELNSKESIMLPINLNLYGTKIIYSTAEIQGYDETHIHFRLTQSEDVIKLRTNKEILSCVDYTVEKIGEDIFITSHKHGKVDDQLTICFEPL